MQCDYFDAGRCRSCTLMGVPYETQLRDKQRAVGATLAPVAPGLTWLDAVPSPESGFRNKAKLVVGGRTGRPTLGILDAAARGVDLTGCGLYEPGLADLVPVLGELVAATRIPPYDVARRRGELKHVHVTHSPTGESMVRFVLRSPAEVPVVEHNVAALQCAVPGVRVVTVNLLPQHAALLEGDEEHVLTPGDTLPMPVNGITLLLRPRSFFQTNTQVAAALYRQAAAWADDLDATSVTDLYCGVGGFALHCARPGRRVLGVETSAEAVAGAREAASLSGVDAAFVAGDATAWEHERDGAGRHLVVVNPPRRGIGPDLAHRIEESDAAAVVYSSCNAESLARDIAALPSFRAQEAGLFDMFPQTEHHEVMVRLVRTGRPA